MRCLHPAVSNYRWPIAALRCTWHLACTVALLVLAIPVTAQTDRNDVDVQAERKGALIEVRARALLRAPMDVVWRTLTDYERLPEFIPGLETSRVIRRNGAQVLVAQTGRASFLFLTVPIAVVLESTERPPHVVEVRRVSGSIHHLQGRYEARPQVDGRVSLSWVGLISPDTDLPPLIETTLVRLSIREQFVGMVQEIERRAGTRSPAPQPRAQHR